MTDKTGYPKFEPPKLPFAWLATTFVAPVAASILTYIMSNKMITVEVCIIIGLALWAAMLVAACIMLMLERYREEFSRQSLELKCIDLEQKHKTIMQQQRDITDFNTKLLADVAEMKAMQEILNSKILALSPRDSSVNEGAQTYKCDCQSEKDKGEKV